MSWGLCGELSACRPIVLIGGELARRRDRFEVHDPATGAVLATVADASVDDALAALGAAHAAQPAWAALAPRRRGEVLRGAFERMLARADALAELIVRENGKPIAEARGEVVYAAEFFRWFAEEAVRIEGRLLTAPAAATASSPCTSRSASRCW